MSGWDPGWWWMWAVPGAWCWAQPRGAGGRCLGAGRSWQGAASTGTSALLGLRLRLPGAEHSPEVDEDWNVQMLGACGAPAPPVRLRPLPPSGPGTAPAPRACSSVLERGHFYSSPASHLLLTAHLVPNRSFSIPNLWLTRLLKSCSALPKPNRILYDILGKGGVWSSL